MKEQDDDSSPENEMVKEEKCAEYQSKIAEAAETDFKKAEDEAENEQNGEQAVEGEKTLETKNGDIKGVELEGIDPAEKSSNSSASSSCEGRSNTEWDEVHAEARTTFPLQTLAEKRVPPRRHSMAAVVSNKLTEIGSNMAIHRRRSVLDSLGLRLAEENDATLIASMRSSMKLARQFQATKLDLNFQKFSQGGLHKLFLSYMDENGYVDKELESNYLDEWWIMANCWVNYFAFIYVILVIGLIIQDFVNDHALILIRTVLRSSCALVVIVYYFIKSYMTLEHQRRGLVFVILYYFSILILCDTDYLARILKTFQLKPCDYVECFNAFDLSRCSDPIVPYVVAQVSVIGVLFRLPYFITLFILIYLIAFYWSLGLMVQIKTAQQFDTAVLELFHFVVTFSCVALSSHRGEILSRYLFAIQWKKKMIRNSLGDGSCSSSLGARERALSKKCDVKALYEVKINAENMRGRSRSKIQIFLWRLYVQIMMKLVVKRSFMPFERNAVVEATTLCISQMRFVDLQLEFCFMSARLKVSWKNTKLTVLLACMCLFMLSVQDWMYLGDSNAMFIIRIVMRGVSFAVFIIVYILLDWLLNSECIERNALLVLLCILTYLVLCLILNDPARSQGIVGGADYCKLMKDYTEETKVTYCGCYSLVAFLTAHLSWILVQLRLPYYHSIACVTITALLYFATLPLVQEDSQMGKFGIGPTTCLLLAFLCFTMASHRGDILARTLFLAERGSKEDESESFESSTDTNNSGMQATKDNMKACIVGNDVKGEKYKIINCESSQVESSSDKLGSRKDMKEEGFHSQSNKNDEQAKNKTEEDSRGKCSDYTIRCTADNNGDNGIKSENEIVNDNLVAPRWSVAEEEAAVQNVPTSCSTSILLNRLKK